MKINVMILLVFQFISSYAQNSFPNATTNPVWRVALSSFWGTTTIGNFTLNGDTVINGKHYEKIISKFPPDFEPFVEGFSRKDGKKVFIVTIDKRRNRLSNEKLMYDFSLEVNKRVFCALNSFVNSADSTICWAESIDSMTYMGITRKVWNMKYVEGFSNTDPPVSFRWIEGIGSPTHPFLALPCISDACEIVSNTLCFEESAILKYTRPSYSTCSTPITSTKESINQEEVKLYPRLATYQLTVENNGSSNLNIQISNSLGQLFIVKQLEKGVNTIDISGLASGIYFATMSGGHKRRTEKFIKN